MQQCCLIIISYLFLEVLMEKDNILVNVGEYAVKAIAIV